MPSVLFVGIDSGVEWTDGVQLPATTSNCPTNCSEEEGEYIYYILYIYILSVYQQCGRNNSTQKIQKSQEVRTVIIFN